jgi:tetratricopeptide (TPR) repeat protein
VREISSRTILVRLFIPLLLIPILGLSARPHVADIAMRNAVRAVAFDSALGASQNIQIALQYYPWRADLMELAGQYAVQGGDFGTGIQLLQRASGYTQLSPASYVALGDGALMQQDVKLALQVWEIALRSGGDPYALYTRMANAHRSLGDHPAAIADLEQAAELQPNNGQIQYQLGLLIATQDPEDAIEHLLRAAELDPALASTINNMPRDLRTASLAENKAYALLSAGRDLASLEEWELAAEAFYQATRLQPDYAEPWAYLGEARQHLSEGQRSVPFDQDIYQDLQTALRLDPGSVSANTLMGLYWRRQDRDELALIYFHAAAALEPDNPAFELEIGNTLARLGQLSQAKEHYQRAVDLAPRDPLYWRALATFSINNQVEVREVGLPAARQAVVLGPEDVTSLDVMGQVFTLLNDSISAERFLQRALQEDPGYAPARLHLGFIYLIRGDTTQAREQISLAHSLAEPGTSTSVQASRLLQTYFP